MFFTCITAIVELCGARDLGHDVDDPSIQVLRDEQQRRVCLARAVTFHGVGCIRKLDDALGLQLAMDSRKLSFAQFK